MHTMFQAGDSDLEDVEVILDRARGPRKCSESSERLKVQTALTSTKSNAQVKAKGMKSSHQETQAKMFMKGNKQTSLQLHMVIEHHQELKFLFIKTPGLLGRKKAQKNRKTNHWSVRKRRTRQRSKSNNERLLPVPVTAAPPMSLPIESPGTRRRGHNVSPTSRYQLRKKSVIGDSSPSTVSHLRQGASDQDVCKQGTERSGTFKSGCNNITGSPDEHSQEAFFEHTSQQVGLPHNPSKGCLSGTDGDTKVGTSPKSHITSQNEMSEESSLCPSDITHLPEAQTDSHEAQYELGIELPNTHHVPIIPILDSQSHNTSHHTHLEGSGSSMSSMDPAHISLECGEDHHKEGELKKRQRMRFIKSSSLSLETEGNQATQCVDGLPLDSQEGKSRESSPSVRFRLRRKTLFEEPCPTSIPDVEQEAKVQNVHKKTETSRTTKSSHKNRESLGTSSNQSQEAVLDWTSSQRYWLRKQHVISDSDPSSISDHEQVAKDLNVHEKESKKIRAAKYDFGNVGESLSSAAKQSQEATKEYSSKGSLTDDHGLKAKDLCESLSVNQHEEHEKSPSMANDTHVQEAHKGAFKYDEMKKKGLSDDLLVSRAPFHELESCNIPSCIPGTHPDADTSLDYEPILHETDKDDNEKKELKDGNTRKQVFPFEDFDPVSIARRKNSFSQEVQNREFSSPIRKSQVCKKSDNAGSGSTSTICEVSETAGMLLPPCSTTTNYAKTSHENGAEIVKVSPNTTQKSSAYQEQGNGRQENLLDDPEKVQLEDSDQQSAQCHPGLSFEDAEGKQCSPVATNASDMVQPSACTPCFISLPKMFLGNDVSNDGLASSTFRSETEEMDYEPEAFGSCVNYADSPIRSTSMADPTKDRNSYEKGNAIASDSSSSDSSSSDDDMSSSSSSSSLSSKAGNLGQLPSGSCSSWSNSSKEEAGTREKISLHSDDEKGPQKNEDPKLSESADNEDGRQSFKWKKQRTFSAPGSIVEEVGEDDAIVIDDEDDLPILSVSDTSDGGCEEEKGSEGSQQDSHGMSVTSITKSDDSQLWISVHSCKSTATPGGARHEVVSQVVETENYEKIEHMTGPCHLSQVKPSKTASPEKSPANKKEKETFGAILRNIYQRSCYQHIFSECFGTCRYNHNVMLADVMSHQEELSWDYDQAVSHFHWVMGKERRFRRLKIDIFCHLVESLLNADQSGESLKVICQYGPRSPRVLDLLMKKVEEIGTKLQPFQQLHPLIQKVRKHAYVPTATQMICILDIMLYHRCTEGLLDWADYLVQQSLMVLPKSILNRTVSLVLSTTKQDPHQNWLTKFYAVLAKMSESDICNMDPYHATLVIDALDQNGYGAEAMYLRNMVFPQEASVSQQRHSSGPVWASAAQRQIDLQNSAFGKKRMSDLMHRMPIQDGSDSEEKSQVESQRQVFMLMQQNAYGEIAQLLMDLDMSTKAGHMCVQQITKHLISSGCPGQDFDVFVTKIFEHMKDKYPSSDILQKVAEIAACLLSHLKEQKCSDNEFLRVLDVVMLQNLDLMQVSKESQRKESGYIILLYIQLLGKTNRLPEVVPKLKELRGSLPSLKPAHVDFACHVMKKVINKCILNVKLCSEALECFRFLLEVCQDGILQDKIGESSCDGGPNSYLEQIEGLLAGMAMSVFNSRSASHINKLKDLAMEKKEFFFTPVHLPILREMVVHLVNLEVLEDAKAWFTICSRKGLLVPFSKTGPSSGLIVTPSPSESLGDVLLRMREALDRIQDSFPLFRITPQNLAPNAVIFQSSYEENRCYRLNLLSVSLRLTSLQFE
ncbi:unnamed protein product [Darwinula stevensoni]|uniref:Uncharacterized protein n=1 Tax=Darwinula stevensoni TaxID=69355 RepID=A0A7R8X0L8_9CRUS|nr:unnamed protein product [Darwinula stevensoni]CAG0881792.1 unnamed protein product [Darwinula stevensoni]